MLYANGAGDMSFYIYEYSDTGKMIAIPPCTQQLPIKAATFLPKHALSVDDHEVGRCARIANDKTMEFIAFRLPSRTGVFDQSLYPVFDANQPASDYDTWAKGEDVPAKTMQLKPAEADNTGAAKKKGNFLAKLGKAAPKEEEESKSAAGGDSSALNA